jgi:putative hydrolase of the HAD superfamily
MSTAPSVVLFDLDGVLAHYAHAPRLERLARRCGVRVEEVAAALFESGLEHDADLGVYDAAGQVDALARRLGRPVSLEDCIDARRAAMRVDPDMLALVREIAGRARISILTNNNFLLRDHLPRICAPLFPLFEGQVFCSAQFGLAKPDPEIFRACARELRADPHDLLFIDDKAENAAGAREAGLHAHHYRGIAGLRTECRRLGLIGEPVHAC